MRHAPSVPQLADDRAVLGGTASVTSSSLRLEQARTDQAPCCSRAPKPTPLMARSRSACGSTRLVVLNLVLGDAGVCPQRQRVTPA